MGKTESHFLKVLSLVMVFAGFYFFANFLVEAQAPLDVYHLTAQEEIKILPELWEGGWQNPEAVFSQDLPETATFEEFNAENSAYPVGITRKEREAEHEINTKQDGATTTQATTTDAQATTSQEQIVIVSEEAPTSTATTTVKKNKPSFFAGAWEKLKNVLGKEVRAEETATSVDGRSAFADPTTTTDADSTTTRDGEQVDIFHTCEKCQQVGGLATATDQTATDTDQTATDTDETTATDKTAIDEGVSTTTEVSSPTDERPEEQASSSPGEFLGEEKALILSHFGVSPPEKTEIKTVQLRLSMAAKKLTQNRRETQDAEQTQNGTQNGRETIRETDAKLLIDYYHKDNWQKLAELNLENEISNGLNGGYFLYALPVFDNWDDLQSLKIRFIFQTNNLTIEQFNNLPQVFLDAAWLEVEYDYAEQRETEREPVRKLTEKEAEKGYTFDLISEKKDFRTNEAPAFRFRYQKKRGFAEAVGANILGLFREEKKPDIKVAVLESDIAPDVRLQENGEFFVALPELPRQFRPGKHQLKIELEDQGKAYVETQDFTWGVLAINTNKSIFLPSEQAYLQMAALRDDGHTICDANLKLEIREIGEQFSVSDGELFSVPVQKSGECGPNNVTTQPDYFAYYQVGEAGVYQMTLTNLDNGYEITDSFEARESVPFEVERIGPTRIFPPAIYEMRIRIRVNQDFQGVIKEFVPASFEVVSHESTQIRTQNNTKEIFWEVDWKTGETYELKYQFDAPDISPYLYLLGPLEFIDTN